LFVKGCFALTNLVAPAVYDAVLLTVNNCKLPMEILNNNHGEDYILISKGPRLKPSLLQEVCGDCDDYSRQLTLYHTKPGLTQQHYHG
jgi:hypothetical protein